MVYDEEVRMERERSIIESRKVAKALLLETAKKNVKKLVNLSKYEDFDEGEVDILKNFFYAFDEHGFDQKRKESLGFLKDKFHREENQIIFEKLGSKGLFTMADYLRIEELSANKTKRKKVKTIRALENLKDVFDEIGWDQEARLKLVSRTTKEDKIRERFSDIKEKFGVKIIYDRGYLLSVTQDTYDEFVTSAYKKIDVIKKEFSGNIPEAFNVRVDPSFISYNPITFSARLREFKESLEDILVENDKFFTDKSDTLRYSIISMLSRKGIIGKRYTPVEEIIRYVANSNGDNGRLVEGKVVKMEKDGILLKHKQGRNCYSLDPAHVNKDAGK